MGAQTKVFNLAIRVNDKEVKTTMNSVGKELRAQRGYVRNLEEGTKKWNEENAKLAKMEKTYDGMKTRQREFINQTKEGEKSLQNNRKAINQFGEAFGQVTGGIVTGDLMMVQEGLKGMRTSIIGATKAAVAFIATPLGMVLAGLAVAIGAVTQYFRDSEEGQNAWNKVSAVTGVVVGNLTDLLSFLGKIIVDVFSNPKETIEALGSFIKTNIENRITGLIKFFPKLGEAIDLALSGNFKEAGKVAFDAVTQITTGVENFSDKAVDGFNSAKDALNDYGNEMASEVKRQMELSDMAAEADKIERQLIVDKGKVEAQVAEARRKARDEENLSAEERQKLLNEAKAAQDDLYEREIKAAEIRRQIKAEENQFSNSTKEDLTEEAELTAKVDQLRRQKADAGRNLMRDELRINNELLKASKDLAKADQKRLDELAKLETEYNKKKEDRLADSALKQAELEQKRALEKAQALGAEQELIDQIRAEHQIKIDEAKAEEEAKELERMRTFDEKRRELENELELQKAETEAEKEEIRLAQELEKEELAWEKKLEEFQKEMEFLQMTEEEKAKVEQAIKESHEATINGIHEKWKNKELKKEEEIAQAKRQLWSDSLNAAINIAGQETKIGQALLIAKQLIAAKEMAVELGLFQSKMSLKAAEATGDIAAGTAKTAAVGFPQNIPLLIGFAAQVVGIVGAIRNAAKAKKDAKTTGFFNGGHTGYSGLGFIDDSGHEPVGYVHKNEYVIPEIVRKDPEMPQIEKYIENKRRKKLGLFYNGGPTSPEETNPVNTGADYATTFIAAIDRLLERLEIPLKAIVTWDYETEQKRQAAQKKLDKIKSKSKIKNS
ncbi:hypothetical protein [Zunongwangia endophytica]|uniref:Uncharacterized protein n=1 Tax=Zunongwangia endophytica TaxID=1808945 RepID=A0ABV8H5Q6_9FLAO|nr:hypothetical protein [Zunongwangia endophytica]MDN3595333.1 hypothetical protein [Zunongwangia endophytica]